MDKENLNTDANSSPLGKLEGANIVIINYGAGNIKSIQFAFKRLGFEVLLTNNSEKIKAADKVIFPGVGEASSAMQKLKESGLDCLIPQLKQPVLGICLGMQLMCKSTEEGNTKGLGIFDVDVKRFSNTVKVPQMGWNTIITFNQICLKISKRMNLCIWCIVFMQNNAKKQSQQQLMM